jgi:hypothetical protein
MRIIKDDQLQIRVTRKEKDALRKRAQRQGMDLSSYILSETLPDESVKLQELVNQLSLSVNYRIVLAEINDLLVSLSGKKLKKSIEFLKLKELDEIQANYLASMVEYACLKNNIPQPEWTKNIPPLTRPYFASSLKSLRIYLLINSPPPFKARNIFIDSSLGDRV